MASVLPQKEGLCWYSTPTVMLLAAVSSVSSFQLAGCRASSCRDAYVMMKPAQGSIHNLSVFAMCFSSICKPPLWELLKMELLMLTVNGVPRAQLLQCVRNTTGCTGQHA